MKKIYLYAVALAFAAGVTACGGSSETQSTENTGTTEATESAKGTFELVSDVNNNPAGVEGFISFDGARGELELDGHMLNLKVYPKVTAQTDQVVDYPNGKVYLLDENGNQLGSLHQTVASGLNKALNSGDTYFSDYVYYLTSCSSDADAKEIAEKAKTFVVVMTLVDPADLEAAEAEISGEDMPDLDLSDLEAGLGELGDVVGALENMDPLAAASAATKASDNSGNSNKNAAKADNWDPVGTYQFTDDGNSNWTLVLSSGGNATLERKGGSGPMKGSWSKGNGGEYVSLDFFSGPFVVIGNDSYITDAVMTKTDIYNDLTQYKKGGARVAVTKIK